MTENLFPPFLIIVFVSAICLTKCSACNLVPSNGGSCLELTADPYITFDTSQFGYRIEGASVNPAGDMFAVCYGERELRYQLGQFAPQQRLFYSDVDRDSSFTGIRFLNSQTAFIADLVNHRVLKLNVGTGNVVSSSEDFCSNADMIQPNDLAVSKAGTVYTSGGVRISNSNSTSGDIWSCLPNGTVRRLELLGITNGIELSPDEQHLYVTETFLSGSVPIAKQIWKYNTNIVEGTIGSKSLFLNFTELGDTTDIDGLKTDINGNLFVTRYYGQRIEIFSPEGELIGKIALNFRDPSNLEFGGPNGTTLFIVGQCQQEGKGCVDKIEVVTPGRAWTMLQTSAAWSMIQINSNLNTILLIIQLFYWMVAVLLTTKWVLWSYNNQNSSINTVK